jgi:hypothetical protein
VTTKKRMIALASQAGSSCPDMMSSRRADHTPGAGPKTSTARVPRGTLRRQPVLTRMPRLPRTELAIMRGRRH